MFTVANNLTKVFMYKNTLKKKKVFEKINFFSLCLVAFSMPFGIYLTKLAIVLWIFTWLLQLNISKLKIKLDNYEKIIFLVIILFFILEIIGYFYSDNKIYALKSVEIKLFMFLFPIIFISANNLYNKHHKEVLGSFVAGNLFVAIISIIIAFAKSIHFTNNKLVFQASDNADFAFFEAIANGGNYFFYTDFSQFLHPSYASILIIFSIIILFFLNKQTSILQKDFLSKILSNRKLIFLSIFFLTIVTFLFSSKANIIAVCVLLFLIIIFSEIKFKYHYLAIILLISVAFVSRNSRFTTFFKYLSKDYRENISSARTGTQRLYIWKSAFEVTKESPLFGFGTGDVTNELVKKYKKNNNKNLEKRKLNSHNEFIETQLRLGLLGIAFLLFIFIAGGYLAYKNRNYFLLFFFIITVINFFFETMLNRLAGVIFWSFFLNFLLFIKPLQINNNRQISTFIEKIKKLDSFAIFIIPFILYLFHFVINKNMLSQNEIISNSWFKVQHFEITNLTEFITGSWLYACKIPNIYWLNLLPIFILALYNTIVYNILKTIITRFKIIIFIVILVIALILGFNNSFYFNNYNLSILFFLLSLLYFFKFLKQKNKRWRFFIPLLFFALSFITLFDNKNNSPQYSFNKESIELCIKENNDIFINGNYATNIPIIPYLVNKKAILFNANNTDFELNIDKIEYIIISKNKANSKFISKIEKNYKFAYSNEEIYVYRNSNANLWTKKTSWNLPKDGKNNSLFFNKLINEHGIYTVSAKIKYFENDSSINPRITLIAEYDDSIKQKQVEYNLIKDGVERYYKLSLKTDSSKNIIRVYGWILDHSKVNGEKHVSVKEINIGLK